MCRDAVVGDSAHCAMGLRYQAEGENQQPRHGLRSGAPAAATRAEHQNNRDTEIKASPWRETYSTSLSTPPRAPEGARRSREITGFRADASITSAI